MIMFLVKCFVGHEEISTQIDENVSVYLILVVAYINLCDTPFTPNSNYNYARSFLTKLSS